MQMDWTWSRLVLQHREYEDRVDMVSHMIVHRILPHLSGIVKCKAGGFHPGRPEIFCTLADRRGSRVAQSWPTRPANLGVNSNFLEWFFSQGS